MYWSGSDYDRMAKLAIEVLCDYNITEFPLNEKAVCQMIGVKLVPYSAYSDDDIRLLMKKSKDAFYIPPTKSTPPTIVYNDFVENDGRKRFSIFHEIKHYVNGDTEEGCYNDNMADYFGRYIMCPIPLLIKRGIDDKLSIISDFGLSDEAAGYALNNARNRRATYGNHIFEYEKPLIELLHPEIKQTNEYDFLF